MTSEIATAPSVSAENHLEASDWLRAKPHVEKLLDAEVNELEAYFDRELADDPRLRSEVAAYLRFEDGQLLEIDGRASQALPSLFADFAEDEPADPWCGRSVGDWRLESVLGHGGMAVVYRATREGHGYVQEAALKWLPMGFDSPTLRARFQQEQAVLARLRHVGISSLIDGGVSEDGRPYVVMELVDGRPLVEYCEEEGLGLEARLRLMVDICDAVAYAHRRLVVHRDLKPSNVLVTRDGRIKLLDFGIAKVLDAVDAPPTELNAPMTPAYASPEQRQGESITTVSDVYALGLMLWRLIAGRRCPEWHPGAPVPTPPSRIAGTVVGETRSQLVKDLDAVVLRCLEEQPDDRYLSAEALARDLENLLAARPVTARKISRTERLRRWVLQNQGTSMAIGAAALFLLAGIIMSSVFAYQADRERKIALQEANKSRAAMVFVEGLLDTSQSSPQLGVTLTVEKLLGEAQKRLDNDLRAHPALQRELLSLMARVYRSFSLHDEAVAMAQREFDLIRRHDPDVIEHALAQQRLGYEMVLAGDPLNGAQQLESAITTLRGRLGVGSGLAGLLSGQASLDPRLLDTMRLQSYAVGSRPFAETMELRRLVLEGERYNAAGADSLRVAQALNDYARTLYFDGRLDEAAADLVEADAMRRRLDAHPLDLSVSLGNLSMVHLGQGQWLEAEAAARQSLRLAVEVEGAGHPRTAGPLIHLGRALRAQGRHEESLEVTQSALAIRRQFLPNHTRLGSAYSLLAALRCDEGDYAAAEELFLKDRAFKVATYSAKNWRVGVIDGERGRCLNLAGKHVLAREVLEAGLQLVVSDLGSRSPVTLKIQGYLADL